MTTEYDDIGKSLEKLSGEDVSVHLQAGLGDLGFTGDEYDFIPSPEPDYPLEFQQPITRDETDEMKVTAEPDGIPRIGVKEQAHISKEDRIKLVTVRKSLDAQVNAVKKHISKQPILLSDRDVKRAWNQLIRQTKRLSKRKTMSAYAKTKRALSNLVNVLKFKDTRIKKRTARLAKKKPAKGILPYANAPDTESLLGIFGLGNFRRGVLPDSDEPGKRGVLPELEMLDLADLPRTIVGEHGYVKAQVGIGDSVLPGDDRWYGLRRKGILPGLGGYEEDLLHGRVPVEKAMPYRPKQQNILRGRVPSPVTWGSGTGRSIGEMDIKRINNYPSDWNEMDYQDKVRGRVTLGALGDVIGATAYDLEMSLKPTTLEDIGKYQVGPNNKYVYTDKDDLAMVKAKGYECRGPNTVGVYQCRKAGQAGATSSMRMADDSSDESTCKKIGPKMVQCGNSIYVGKKKKNGDIEWKRYTGPFASLIKWNFPFNPLKYKFGNLLKGFYSSLGAVGNIIFAVTVIYAAIWIAPKVVSTVSKGMTTMADASAKARIAWKASR